MDEYNIPCVAMINGVKTVVGVCKAVETPNGLEVAYQIDEKYMHLFRDPNPKYSIAEE